MQHASFPEIVKRLRRAEGHLKSILAMIDAERSCLDIAQQLHAVEAAVRAAKKALIHDHIEHCLRDGAGESALEAKALVAKLKQLAKYL